MQRNIDKSTRPLLLSSVMEEKAFGVTLAEGRGWRLQQRTPPIRGWERAGGGSRATAHSCLCVCEAGFLSPEVCWCSGTDAPSLWGLLVAPAQWVVIQGGQRICRSLQAPSLLVVFTSGSTLCCFFAFPAVSLA